MKSLTQTIISVIAIAFFTLLSSSEAKAQSIYDETVEYLRANGFSISKELYCDLKQGQYCYNTKTFSAGLKYIIVACSEDYKVKDIDILVYYQSGTLYVKDEKIDRCGILSFTPTFDTTLNVYIKNYSSDSYYSSRVKYVIAYK